MRSERVLTNFASEFSLRRFNDLASFAASIDVCLMLSANWHDHYQTAKYLIDRDIQVLIDKPIAGSGSDIRKFYQLADQAKLFGGSALPYTSEWQAFQEKVKNASIAEIEITGPGGGFFYSIHRTELLTSLVSLDGGSTISTTNDRIEISSPRTNCRLSVSDSSLDGWRINVKTEEGALHVVTVSTANVYENYLDAFVKNCLGLPATSFLGSSLRACQIELTAVRSQHTGKQLHYSDLTEQDEIDPKLFLSEYRAKFFDQPL